MTMMEERKEDFDFRYMRDHEALWTQLMDSFRDQPALILQVGNGNIEKSVDITLWLVAKLLRHKDAKVFCCDAFVGDGYTQFTEKTKPFSDKIVLCRGIPHDFVKTPAIRQRKFYMAFVDIVDLLPEQIIEILVLAFRQLHFGGLLIVDTLPDSSPMEAFVALYRQTLTVIVSGSQLVLRKRSPEELPPDRLAALQKEVQLQADLNPPPATIAARKLDACVQLFNDKCYADAISACDQIISLGAMAGPSLRQAYINRAAIRCVQGMVPDAVKTLKRAIQNGLDDQVIRSEAERLQKLAIVA